MAKVEIVPIKPEYEKRAYEIWYYGMTVDVLTLFLGYWARKKSTWAILSTGWLTLSISSR